MGAKKQAYKDIAAHLMATIGTTVIGQPQTITYLNELEEEVTGSRLPWAELNRGQIQHLTKELGIPLPAVLISFPEINYSQLGAGLTEGDVIVRITSLFESFADSYFGSVNQDIALQYLEFNDLLFQTLEGLKGATFSNLTRTNETEDDDYDFLIITNTDYTCTLLETGGVKTIEFMEGNPTPKRVATTTTNTLEDAPGQFVNPLLEE